MNIGHLVITVEGHDDGSCIFRYFGPVGPKAVKLIAAVGADCRCFINPVTGEPYPLWAGDHYQGDIDHDPDCSAAQPTEGAQP